MWTRDLFLATVAFIFLEGPGHLLFWTCPRRPSSLCLCLLSPGKNAPPDKIKLFFQTEFKWQHLQGTLPRTSSSNSLVLPCTLNTHNILLAAGFSECISTLQGWKLDAQTLTTSRWTSDLFLWCNWSCFAPFFPFSCIRMVSSVVEQLRGNSRTASEIGWHSFPTKWKEPLTFMDLGIDYTSMSQSNHCSNTCVGTGTSLGTNKCLWNKWMSESSGIRGDLLFLGRSRWLILRFTTRSSPTLCRGVTVLIIKHRTQEIKSLHTGDEFVAENHLSLNKEGLVLGR